MAGRPEGTKSKFASFMVLLKLGTLSFGVLWRKYFHKGYYLLFKKLTFQKDIEL